MKRKLLIPLLLAAGVSLVGCVVTPQPSYVYREPPPPRVEYAGYPPITGYIWISGYWVWGGHGYEWLPGRWEAPRPGYRWVAPRWERSGDRWHQHEGRWDRDPAWHGPAAPQPAPRYDREPPRAEPMPRRDYDADRGAVPRYEREAPRPQVTQPPPQRVEPPRRIERRDAPSQQPAPQAGESRSHERRDEGRNDDHNRGRPDFRRERGDDR